MGKLTVIKAVFTKKMEDAGNLFGSGDEAKRVDGGLPLGLKINNVIELPTTKFVLGKGQFLSENPGKKHYVTGYSKVQMFDDSYCRFYLSSDDGEKTSVLEVLHEGDKVLACTLFQEYDEIEPECAEDWEAWLNDRDGMIGDLIFNVLQDDEEIPFHRVVASDHEERIEPESFSERVITDPFDSQGIFFRNQGMFYVRDVQAGRREETEQLFLTCEENNNEAKIRIFVGVEIEPTTIKTVM